MPPVKYQEDKNCRDKEQFSTSLFTQISTAIPQTQQEAPTDQVLSFLSKIQESRSREIHGEKRFCCTLCGCHEFIHISLLLY